jgi:hypothetical protein
MESESLKTFNILKYGTMTPEKAREVIDLYWDDAWPGYHKSDWTIAKVKGTSESEYCITHFYKLWVYYDDKWCQTLVAFIPEFIDGFPSNKWLQVAMIIVTMDITDKSEDEVYELFAQNYKELHDISAFEEYKRNFPDDIISDDI